MSPVSKPTDDGSFGGALTGAQPRQTQPPAEDTSSISHEAGVTVQFLRLQEGEDYPDLEGPGRQS